VRIHRVLVPVVAGIIVAGVLVTLTVALTRNTPNTSTAGAPVASREEVAALVALKNEAEALAIGNKLPDAHAKYRELFARAQGREIKDPAFWDLIERAKIDQDRIYVILLSQNDPARVLTPPLPSEIAAAQAAATRSTTMTASTTLRPPRRKVSSKLIRPTPNPPLPPRPRRQRAPSPSNR